MPEKKTPSNGSPARSPAKKEAEAGLAARRPLTRDERQAAEREVESDEPRETAGVAGRAFIDPERPVDDLADELGEEFVKTATSGEQSNEETRDEVLPEETGGPFIETSPNVEFAGGTDESNPIDAEQEAFPTATRTARR